MGDNIWLDDRDGVRTPMQWNPDRNAGFSTVADPGKLYLPVVQSLTNHFGGVNVEAQLATSSSLLHWVRGMLALRKRHPVFGLGAFVALPLVEPGTVVTDAPACDNEAILAFLRVLDADHPGRRARGARDGAVRAQPRLHAAGGHAHRARPRGREGRRPVRRARLPAGRRGRPADPDPGQPRLLLAAAGRPGRAAREQRPGPAAPVLVLVLPVPVLVPGLSDELVAAAPHLDAGAALVPGQGARGRPARPRGARRGPPTSRASRWSPTWSAWTPATGSTWSRCR